MRRSVVSEFVDECKNRIVILTAPTVAFFMITLGFGWRETFMFTGILKGLGK